jgi:CMP-N-acetylneuraminic acid synthetase
MDAPMKVLGLVPARAGSKGIAGKNSRLLMGKPLIQWAIEAGVASGVLDRVIATTEDERLAELAVAAGAEVPFMRPSALADDETPMIDVVGHALQALGRAGYTPDAVALLQPTAPLRQPAHVRAALDMLTTDVDAVCTVTAVRPELSPHYLMRVTHEGRLVHFLDSGASYTRRQDVPIAYRRDGTVYLTRRTILLEQRSFFGANCLPLILPAEESVTIDDPEDWTLAEEQLRNLQSRGPNRDQGIE